MGGLGHMAVKIAHAMGAEVTVLSQTLKKQEDGLRLGADHYFATSDPDTFERLAGSFDLIINTVSASIDISAYLELLTLDGTLVNVGAPAEPLPVNAFALIGGRRSFAGSMIGGIRETQEMLDFCAEHGIGAGDRGHRRRPDQRRLRARPGLRRPLPLRHRHRHPGLASPHRGRGLSQTTPPARPPRLGETVKIQPKQPSVKGPAHMFTGDVYFDVIAAPQPEPSRMRVNSVHFAPCARTAWHSTPSGRPCTSPRESDWSRPAGARSSS